MRSTTLLLAVLLVSFALLSFADDDVKAPKKDEKLRIGILKRAESCTQKTKLGDNIGVHYTGTLKSDGSKFDSSLDRGDPFTFRLGQGMVIKGWDQGLANMCVGEKRRLTIPSSLGYGDRGSPPKIPGGATLVFEVELISIN
ncbi:peptidyl-prolyl cis-trans isomerase FKBP2-like [Planoprotostelium fungivorum]|uniref:peptidylprolyl isomerase n=1 Tax=Planoprotostelium fungivorum TaxID=1890364 RepID=A0A2P6NYG2_9EUKA|nr:peptidyl-prolyl cis-trans isomerase FKBP2-like [Planoprotostelium fungivorum]